VKYITNILLGVILVSIMSCDSAFYKKSFFFEDQTWLYDDARSFDFSIPDTSKVYDMILTVNHTDKFPYQNLYLKTSTSFPSDTVINQLLSVELANEAGYWYGECSGPNCQISIPIQSGVHFADSGNYKLELEQHTRTDTLFGISSIGLKLIELE